MTIGAGDRVRYEGYDSTYSGMVRAVVGDQAWVHWDRKPSDPHQRPVNIDDVMHLEDLKDD